MDLLNELGVSAKLWLAFALGAFVGYACRILSQTNDLKHKQGT